MIDTFCSKKEGNLRFYRRVDLTKKGLLCKQNESRAKKSNLIFFLLLNIFCCIFSTVDWKMAGFFFVEARVRKVKLTNIYNRHTKSVKWIFKYEIEFLNKFISIKIIWRKKLLYSWYSWKFKNFVDLCHLCD